MRIQLDPQRDFVGVTIEDDNDAQAFCDLALEVVMGGQEPGKMMEEIYQGYADQMKRDNHANWDRQLWDVVVRRIQTPVGEIAVTFGTDLMKRLQLI
jgi:hypothetical protein